MTNHDQKNKDGDINTCDNKSDTITPLVRIRTRQYWDTIELDTFYDMLCDNPPFSKIDWSILMNRYNTWANKHQYSLRSIASLQHKINTVNRILKTGGSHKSSQKHETFIKARQTRLSSIIHTSMPNKLTVPNDTFIISNTKPIHQPNPITLTTTNCNNTITQPPVNDIIKHRVIQNKSDLLESKNITHGVPLKIRLPIPPSVMTTPSHPVTNNDVNMKNKVKCMCNTSNVDKYNSCELRFCNHHFVYQVLNSSSMMLFCQKCGKIISGYYSNLTTST